MTVVGLITTEGLGNCQIANNNQGWKIFPTKVQISSTKGALNINRTISSLITPWYTTDISGYNIVDETHLELITEIPPLQNGGVDTTITELAYLGETQFSTFSVNTGTNEITVDDSNLYTILANGDRITIRHQYNLTGIAPNPLVLGQTYYCKKTTGTNIVLFATKADYLANTPVIDITTSGSGSLQIQKEFLLGIGQPVPEIIYYPDMGTYKLRVLFTLANPGDPNLFNFIYSQAAEISTHNNEPNAHPILLTALNKAGIYTTAQTLDYKGQNFDEAAIFDPDLATVEGKPVYLKSNGHYGLAVADGSLAETMFAGVVQNGILRAEGFVKITGATFTVGNKIYLHGSTPGGYTVATTNTEIGIATKTDTILLTKKYNISSSGVTTFLGLTDTPNSYTGQDKKLVYVNGSSLDFVDPTTPGVVPPPTEANTGITTVATTTEINAGINDYKIVTPLKLAQALAGVTGGTYAYYADANIDTTNGSSTITVNSSTVKGDIFMKYVQTGDAVQTVNLNPLTSGTVYYIRKINSTQFSLHTTKSDALANTGAITVLTNTTNTSGIFYASLVNLVLKAQHNYTSIAVQPTYELPAKVDVIANSPNYYIYEPAGGSIDIAINSADYTSGTRFRGAGVGGSITTNYGSSSATVATGGQVRMIMARYDSTLDIWIVETVPY